MSAKSGYVRSGVYGAQLGPIGLLGFLSQTLPTTPGTNYLLSFWLNSPDGEAPNEFQVSWNGTMVLYQRNLPALGWTNIVLQVAAAGSNTVLQLGFRNDSTFFGLDDIGLVTLQPPIITGISLAGTNVVLSAGNGQLGGTYFTLTSTNLALALNAMAADCHQCAERGRQFHHHRHQRGQSTCADAILCYRSARLRLRFLPSIRCIRALALLEHTADRRCVLSRAG